jgi:uncharacterized protein (TIGR02302 family)
MKPAEKPSYRLMLGLASASLLWERLWPRLYPALTVIGTFGAIALLDVLPSLPGWMHVGILVAFSVAFAAALVYVIPGFQPIPRLAARRRLEHDSGLDHRPLTAIEDRLATGVEDSVSRSLWDAHRKRAAATLQQLSVTAPAPGMARRDPRGYRAAVVLILVIGLTAGAGNARERLERAVTPNLGGGLDRAAATEIWIAPPAYTNVAPLYLQRHRSSKADADTVIEVPAGSTAVARVSGLHNAPKLVVGTRETAFEPIGNADAPSAFRVETVIDAGTRLAVTSSDRDIAAWPMRVIADNPPVVEFSEPPGASANAFLRLAYAASDDYGVSEVVAAIEPIDDSAPTSESEIRQHLLLPVPNAPSVESVSTHDFTAHPLAGRRVRIHLEAKDVSDRIGTSAPVEIVLPERAFSHPVAQQIIEERKRLDGDSPTIREQVARTLNGIAGAPERFSHDTVVSLALAVSKSRLLRDRTSGTIETVKNLLWDTALRLEEGTVPFAERQLQRARQQLWEALRADADLQEIERLIDELQRAVDKYLAAAAAELARRAEIMSPTDPGAKVLKSEDLRDLIEMARQLARSGARDSARKLLADLQRILDRVRAGLHPGDKSKDLMEAHRLMSALRSLAERQQELLDQTFEQRRAWDAVRKGASRGKPSPESERKAKQASRDQEALRRDLGELMMGLDSFLGGIPRPLIPAERAMSGAAKILGSNRPGNALPLQTQAVDQLSRAIEATRSELARRLGGGAGMFAEDPDEDGGGGGGDIFGRSPGDGNRGFGIGQVEIPDQMQLQRSQQILEELRRRAGERFRPPEELHYIDRLLQQF